MTVNRRAFLNACTRAGIASPLLPGILYTLAAQAQEAPGFCCDSGEWCYDSRCGPECKRTNAGAAEDHSGND